jgi:hypothetical protein
MDATQLPPPIDINDENVSVLNFKGIGYKF